MENTEQFNSLPSELRAYLGNIADQTAQWPTEDGPWGEMAWEYKEIVQARAALQQLILEAASVSDGETIYFYEPIDAGGYHLFQRNGQ